MRERGYGFRDPGFGGHYDQARRDWDDARESLAVPIASSDRLLGCINITWPARADALAAVAARHLEDLRQASCAIAAAMTTERQSAPQVVAS